jgi:hypothetical protein
MREDHLTGSTRERDGKNEKRKIRHPGITPKRCICE